MGEGGVGEFSLVEAAGGGLEARRDAAGTRPLYFSRSGGWVASDHRFFPGEQAEMLPAGCSLRVGGWEVRRPAQSRLSPFTDFDSAAAGLADSLRSAVSRRVAGMKRVAVAFSGGLDSSVVASLAARSSKVMAVAVSAPGSRDEAGARRGAEMLGIELVEVRVGPGEARAEAAAASLPFAPTPMDRALWVVYSLAAMAAAEAGAECVLLGQLADEQFGGYRKYQALLGGQGAEAAQAAMDADVMGAASRGFVRDEAACSRYLEPRFPFADPEVMAVAARTPVGFKIRDGVRKAVLRGAAAELGVPGEICSAPKKAAQYSSGVLKALG